LNVPKRFDRGWSGGPANGSGRFKWAIVADAESHWVGFQVYKCIGREIVRGKPGRPFFNRDGYTSSPDPVFELSEAQTFLGGTIKWDGCSDWMFNDTPIHYCSMDSAKELGALMEWLYEIAEELMPETWNS
jgi:hypothetical protein